MFYTIQNGGKLDYNLKTYYAKDEIDLNSINTNTCCPGSQAYTANGKLYTLNSNKEWIEVKNKEIPSSGEEIIITPAAVEQIKTGLFNKVTVVGDSNLVPENIKEGTEIFGVEGSAKTTNLKITDGSSLFYNNARLDCMDDILKLCDNITNTSSMFSGCDSLTNLDLSSFDTSNVTNMGEMFDSCTSLISLNLSNFNTSNVTDMYSMFNNCYKLTRLDLSNFNTGNVEDMSYMFHECSSLTSLDLSNFDTSNVFDMSYMFNSCYKLISLNVSNFNTSNVKDMERIFTFCTSLTELNLSSFDTSKVINVSGMLYECQNLTNLQFGYNLGKGYNQKSNNYDRYRLDLSRCSKLTHDSLMNVINNLYDLNLTYNVANGGTLYTQALTLGNTNLAKLTAEEIAIATNKGWTVS